MVVLAKRDISVIVGNDIEMVKRDSHQKFRVFQRNFTNKEMLFANENLSKRDAFDTHLDQLNEIYKSILP